MSLHPDRPGPKSGAVLIMAPAGWGLGAGVREDPEFCLIIKGETLLAVSVLRFRHSFLKVQISLVYVQESFFHSFKINIVP